MADKLLFTPGPLSTSPTVKEAMLHDLGSRDDAFIAVVKEIRSELLRLGGVSQQEGYETVLMQGSGTFGVESVISSVVGKNDQLLVLVNGAYGERIVKMAKVHGITHIVKTFPENEIVTPNAVQEVLSQHPGVTHVACIHSETTTGLFNPITEIGAICKQAGKVFIVDAMSSFGGVQMDIKAMQIDFLVSSSNKCIEGVPGFSFVLCKKSELLKAQGQARSLSLDLYDQWNGLEKNGQFRFTPPTHSLLAFRQAIRELDIEGGIVAREARYKKNKAMLDAGMQAMGFKYYLEHDIQGHIISSFLYPQDPNFDFMKFYQALSDRGLVIYPGKLSLMDAFRIGNIGYIFPKDIEALLSAIKEVLTEMNVRL
ncbi:2-aminoethylphosphonate--pyruvate transaminase [Flavihumibacter sp. RY-1]|uniref:2-aminoethylphosphonate--pyruvate transaminase n=1 Tax=Flavihumibacter fluminis TaxID=2909236 RepID=A0ABS9BEX6_9BACT|nr:2-aminoethylphosphonate--pyruvate transaminase [Flavihumibacter fluminis]MCF1714152.1 2-aminoethylphosphonate--pyruvate transaminase [Flavihumibacter fluminis]